MLSQSLDRLLGVPEFVPFSTLVGCSLVMHLSYADDILIFSDAGKKSIKKVLDIVQQYQSMSRQLVNVAKSCFVLCSKASLGGKPVVGKLTGLPANSFPLGILAVLCL